VSEQSSGEHLVDYGWAIGFGTNVKLYCLIWEWLPGGVMEWIDDITDCLNQVTSESKFYHLRAEHNGCPGAKQAAEKISWLEKESLQGLKPGRF
jgi:hypothetical protein